MSRINPRTVNPARMFAQWGGSEGTLSYWDKDKQENITLDFPFTFLVLDELNTVKGWSDKDHSGFWSNEVYDITNDVLRVKTKNGLVGKGTWAQLENLKAKGARYAKSIYIAYKDETGELVLGNLQLLGAALTAWIEFNKQYDVYKGAVVLVGPSKPKKKGATTYYEPVFEGKNVSEATDNAAKELNVELDKFLKTYLSRQDDTEGEVVADDYPEDESDDQAEAPKKAPAKKKEAPEIEDTDNKIDLSEVPF